MGVILRISTSQAAHFADDTLEGKVVMEVASRNAEGSRAYALKLMLVGRVRTIVEYSSSAGDSSTNHKAVESKDFLSQAMSLGSFAGRVANGTYSFPFSFSLPSDLLPSTEETERGSCSVRYSLKARLHKENFVGGFFSDVVKSKLRLRILGRRWETVAATPTVLGPASGVVRDCCTASGTMTIGCRADRLEVRTDRAIELYTVVRNDSSLGVTAMVINMKQQAKWKARGHKSSKKRTLATITVPGSQIGGAQPRAAGSERGQSLASIAQATREDIRYQVAAGDGTRHRISVPRSALLSMKTDNIEVKHWLVVKLKTTGFNSAPELSVPVHVRPPETALPEATADPVEQRSTQDSPYATTVVEVGANAADMPESVPVVTATVVGVEGIPGSVPAYTATVVQVGAGGVDGVAATVPPRAAAMG